MTNIELVAILKMLKIKQFVTTPKNYRFLFNDNFRLYISRQDNVYYILTTDTIHIPDLMLKTKISSSTLSKLLKLI